MRAREVLGRDLEPGESVMSVIATAINQKKVGLIGTCACLPQEDNWKARSFCVIRNFLFRIGLIKGANGILSTGRKVFEETGGYDESRNTFEHIDLIKRALAQGARWIYLQDVYVRISMRRYEHNGYLKTLLWWAYEAIRYKLGFQSRKWTPANDFKKKKGG